MTDNLSFLFMPLLVTCRCLSRLMRYCLLGRWVHNWNVWSFRPALPLYHWALFIHFSYLLDIYIYIYYLHYIYTFIYIYIYIIYICVCVCVCVCVWRSSNPLSHTLYITPFFFLVSKSTMCWVGAFIRLHFMLMPLGKALIHFFFFFQLWIKSKVHWYLLSWNDNQSRKQENSRIQNLVSDVQANLSLTAAPFLCHQLIPKV